MKTNNTISTVLLLMMVLIFLSHSLLSSMTPAWGATTNASVRRALLIGIGKYEALPRLPGAKNDIKLVHQVLMSQYGFSEKNIRIVQDEAATRSGVLAALQQIVKESGPNDVVYIHYSGHGSQVEDLNGDEPEDALDETIVPQDGRTENIPDITDDELEEILSQLKTPQTVVVLDSCHSGTATRGLEVRVRSVPRDNRVALYKKGENGGIRTRAIVPHTGHPYVLFSGAASHEEALDGPVDGRYHGFFTHSLFKSLQSAPAGASAQEVFAGAKQELKRIQNQFGRTSMPEPQLEAPEVKLGQPLFVTAGQTTQASSGNDSRRPWASVNPRSGEEVVLVNGVALGANPGSVWGIYPNGETQFDPAQAQAFAVVNTVEDTHAVASFSPKTAKISKNARAIMVAPAPKSKVIPVHLRDVMAKEAGVLKGVLQQKLGEVEFVGQNQFARFIVEAKNKTWHVYSADGRKEVMTLPMSGNPQSLEPLAQTLVQSRNASQLLSLENPASMINLQVRVVQIGQRGIAVVSDRMESPVYHIRQSGQPRTLTNSLQLEVTTDTDCYITIVDVDAEGNVNVLFPNPYQNSSFYPGGFVQAGRSILLPDSLSRGNQAGFHWDYANPPGVDTIRVFASTDQTLTNRIRQSVGATSQPGSGTGPILGKPMAQLVSLRQELVGTVTRGLITVPDDDGTAGPTHYESSPSGSMGQHVQAQDFPMDQGGDPHMEQYVETPVAPQTVANQESTGDWTAASVTVLVQP